MVSFTGYINEAGVLNLERFEKFMAKLAEHDMAQFDEIYTDLKYFEAKTGRRNGRSNKSSPDEITSPKKTTNKDLEALLMATEAEVKKIYSQNRLQCNLRKKE